ncbi:MAG: DNA adenine methylase [Clostridia bacterium]|nr:DNA adenine methylase [Clostridia bacterium]
MKAILKYPGAKWKIGDWIIEHFPEHKVYVEPFFGSGAVFFKKKPSYIETINDVDGNIVNLFRVCREQPEELARAMNLTPFSREEFVDCYDMTVGDAVERARRTLVRYHQSFGTSNSSKRSWRNVQTHSGPRCATMWNYLPDVITECCERLKNAQIENIDALKLIQRYDNENTLIYCDPPYLQKLRKRNMYANDLTEAQHIELLDTLKLSKSMVIISGYDNDLYNEALSDWRTDTKQTTVQMGLHRMEKIWMNF